MNLFSNSQIRDECSLIYHVDYSDYRVETALGFSATRGKSRGKTALPQHLLYLIDIRRWCRAAALIIS